MSSRSTRAARSHSNNAGGFSDCEARDSLGRCDFDLVRTGHPAAFGRGRPTFVHPLSITNGDLKPDPFTAKTNAIFEACQDLFVQTTKNLDTKSASVPVAITLDCNGSTMTVQLRGIMDLKYAPNTAPIGPAVCPVSDKAKVVGSGSNLGVGDFLVDDGSSITIKKGTIP